MTNQTCVLCKHCITPTRENENAAKAISELIEDLTSEEAYHRLQHVCHEILKFVCTFNPDWTEVYEDHFCGQFKLKDGVH